MDNNPFRPSSYENKNASVTVNVPDYDFYPSNNYNQTMSSGGFGNASTSSANQGFGFGEDPPGGSGSTAPPVEADAADKSILSHPVWTWKFWQSFFDVDTSEVLRRIFFSFAPWPRYLKTESVDVFIGAKPDLYGPFWISSTLVFVIAVLGNIASYFQSYGECLHWNYNFHQVTAAAVTIFLYVWLLPMLIWTFLWWRNSHGSLKLSGALCLYGYSLSLYIPVSFLWLINIQWLQWLFALTAAALSGFILAYVFWNHLHFNHRTLAVLIGLIVFALHLSLGFGFVGYFFHYSGSSAAQTNCTQSLFTSTQATLSTFNSPVPLNITEHAAEQSAHLVGNLTFATTTAVMAGVNTTVTTTESPTTTQILTSQVVSTVSVTTMPQTSTSGILGTETTHLSVGNSTVAVVTAKLAPATPKIVITVKRNSNPVQAPPRPVGKV